MSDVLGEAEGIIQCKACPWYKACLLPMRFTAEDLRRQMEQTPGMNPEQTADMSAQMISSMAAAAQNSLLEACPVLIERLRANPKFAQRVKEMMQNWGQDEEPKIEPPKQTP